MSKRNRAAKAQPDKKVQPRFKQTVVEEQTGNLAGLAQQPGCLIATAAVGTLRAQAARLGDARLQTIQRQTLAAQIGRVQGNRHLQRVIDAFQGDGKAVACPVFAASTGIIQREATETKPSATKSGRRKDYVFIMGQDPAKAPPTKQFYTAAAKYFAATLPQATMVRDKRDLAAVFSYLRGLSGTVGDLYLVSHANADGTLSFALKPGDKDKKVSYRELRAAIKSSPALFRLSGQIDAGTTIHIKGCRIGQSQKMIELLDKAFGGLGKVIAPTHKQRYRWEGAAVFEYFAQYFIERPGSVKLARSQLLSAFHTKYPHLSQETWGKLLKGVKRQVHGTPPYTLRTDAPPKRPMQRKRWVVAYANGKWFNKEAYRATELLGYQKKDTGKYIDHTYRFKIRFKDGRQGTVEQPIPVSKPGVVIQGAQKWAAQELARPKIYRWKVEKPKRKGMRLFFTARGQVTEYVVGRAIKSKTGQYLRPQTSEKKYYTVSP